MTYSRFERSMIALSPKALVYFTGAVGWTNLPERWGVPPSLQWFACGWLLCAAVAEFARGWRLSKP